MHVGGIVTHASGHEFYVSCILTIGGDLSPKVWYSTNVGMHVSIVSPCDVVQLLNNLAPVRRHC